MMRVSIPGSCLLRICLCLLLCSLARSQDAGWDDLVKTAIARRDAGFISEAGELFQRAHVLA